MKLTEGLRRGDLNHMILPLISVDLLMNSTLLV